MTDWFRLALGKAKGISEADLGEGLLLFCGPELDRGELFVCFLFRQMISCTCVAMVTDAAGMRARCEVWVWVSARVVPVGIICNLGATSPQSWRLWAKLSADQQQPHFILTAQCTPPHRPQCYECDRLDEARGRQVFWFRGCGNDKRQSICGVEIWL